MGPKIIDRVYEYLENQHIPPTRFEKEIGLSNGYLNIQRKREADLGESVIRKIVDNCLDINLEWLMTGKGGMLNSGEHKNSTLNDPEVTYKKKIPLIPVEAVAGIGVQNDYSINLDQIEERYEVPLFKNKGVDFLTYIRGNSMYPKYNAGDVVACSFLRERLYIQWGRVYVLDTKSQGPLIKRLIKGGTDDYLVCRSENEKYGDFNVPFSDIRSLSLVVGVIRLE